MTRLVMLTLVFSTTAFAQAQRPTMGLAPLDLDPSPSLLRVDKELREAFMEALRTRAGVTLASKVETDAALKDLKRQDFRDSNEALASLADHLGVLYGLHVMVSLQSQRVAGAPQSVLSLTGRVVRSDGKLMKAGSVQIPKQKDGVVELTRVLALRLFDELGLKGLPTFKEVEPVKPPPVEPVKPPEVVLPPPPPPPAIDVGLGQRSAGKGLVIGGLGAAVVGGALLGVSAAMAAPLGVKEGALPVGQLATWRTANTVSTAGLAAVIAGAAAAVVGTIVWAGAPAAPVQVGVAPLQGGVAVSLQGGF